MDTAASPFVYQGLPSSGVGFAMFSPESLGCLPTKVMGKTYEKRIVSERVGRSHKLCQGYGVSASRPFVIRYGLQAGVMAEWADDLDGAQVKVPVVTQLGLDLVMASHLPLSAPVAVLSKAKPKGPVVVCAVTYMCDLYVSVDGVPQQDAWILCGEAGSSNADAIKAAFDSVPSDAEAAVKKALEDGPPPPADGSNVRPWGTLVGKSDFGTDHFIHLPLIAVDLATACVEESEMYGPQLLARFAALLAEIGPGEHEWEIRLQPRGVVSADPLRVNAVGQFDKGIGLSEDEYMAKDAAFKTLIQGLSQQAHVAYAHPSLCTTFTMHVPAMYCTGDGPERKVEEFNPHFSQDIAEYCEHARKVATTGASGATVRSVLGKVGPVAHIVLAGHELAGGWTPLGGNGVEKAGERFVAWALWKNPHDDDDDAEGVMVKFWAIRYDRKNHQPVADPERWYSEDIGMFKCPALKVKNKNIDAAIERDAGIWSAA